METQPKLGGGDFLREASLMKIGEGIRPRRDNGCGGGFAVNFGVTIMHYLEVKENGNQRSNKERWRKR